MFQYPIDTPLSATSADLAVRELDLPGFAGIIQNGTTQHAVFTQEASESDLELTRLALSEFSLAGRSESDFKLRIYDHTPLRTDHRFIDFVTGVENRLSPVETIEFGNILRTDYLDEQGAVVVREENTYSYQVPGVINSLVLARVKQFTWFRRDGRPDPRTKTVRKTYNLSQSLEAAAKRRQLLIRQLETEIFGFLFFGVFGGNPGPTTDAAESLRDSIRDPVDSYLSSSRTQGLVGAFANDTMHPWLDTVVDPASGATIRQISIGRIV